ncbi:MAG: tRNA pseudouridine(55) synthase TruB [Myxococcota bacterium]
MRTRSKQDGILLVDKPGGMTSHDVVGRVRRAFGQREVGHAGTLDPMATGLLVLGLGDATRLLRFIEAATKTYVGTITLGRATTTFDAEGETTETAEVAMPDRAGIEAALASLTGVIEQAVPAYSAVKVGGERLYQKARRGEAVEAPVRTIEIHRLTIQRVEGTSITLEAVVSKGTYIRSLAVAVGQKLGAPAHLSMLSRTAIGRFSLGAAHRLDALRGEPDELLPLHTAVEHLPALTTTPEEAEGIRVGKGLSRARIEGSAEIRGAEAFRLLGPDGALLAMAAPKAPAETDLPQAAGHAFLCVLVRR